MYLFEAHVIVRLQSVGHQLSFRAGSLSGGDGLYLRGWVIAQMLV
jgi:hypothetical protein